MDTEQNLTDRLRDQIVGALHVGYLHPGDRLPSYREVSREWEVDHRPVARAYRVLEAEGLVEIRVRSGVFVAEQEHIGGGMLPETGRWVAEEVLTEAWRRRIPIPGLPKFIHRCTALVQPRCACIESTEDHRVVLAQELREQFGFEAFSVELRSIPRTAIGEQVIPSELPSELTGAELLVTTAFHAAEVRTLAEALEKPVVVVAAHPEVRSAIARRLREGPLTVVCVDPEFGERLRSIYGREYPRDGIRIVLADDSAGIAALKDGQSVLLTTAAYERVGDIRRPLVVPLSLSLSPESAKELAMLLIRFNLEAQDAGM